MAAGSAGEGAGSNTEAPLETFSSIACQSEIELAWVVRAPRVADKNEKLYLMLDESLASMKIRTSVTGLCGGGRH